MNKEEAVQLLSDYRTKQARILSLGSYSVGAGIRISRLSEEDHLQQLHRQLRGRPSYMYLNKQERELEELAHAYLTRYPAGVKSQLAAVPDIGASEEDDKQLRKLRDKIKAVIDARAGGLYDLDAVLERLAELQDLRAEVARIEDLVRAVELANANLGRLLRSRYLDGSPVGNVRVVMNVSESTYKRWHNAAIELFCKLAL